MEEKKKTIESQLPSTESESQRKRVKLERMPELPDEIIDDIISRFPIKSLLRFRSVCKRWLSIISNPNFHRKISPYESILIVEESESETLTASLYSIEDEDNKAVIEASFSIMCNEQKKPGKEMVISNSCNGLVIIGFGDSFFVFNPSTRYFTKVLSCPHGFEYVTIGFCYDASINDYKVVVWLSRIQKYSYVVAAATLKSKRWVPVNYRFNITSANGGPIVNERLHMTVEDKEYNYNRDKRLTSRSKKIVRYDPCANLFEEFPSPIGDGNAAFCLGVLGECLCMARWVDNGKFAEERIEVMTMKEYGVRESWTTLFFLSSDIRPFLFTKNCEIFMKKKRVFIKKRRFSNSSLFPFTKNSKNLIKKNLPELLAYNLRKETTTDLGMLSDRNWWDSVSFVENFDSPVGCEWDEMLHKEHGRRIEWPDIRYATRNIC